MAIQKQRRKINYKNTNVKSFFTESKTEPDYKEYEVLKQFLTERGKIIPRARTGLTQSQQRKLTIAIKRARFLARLPFVTQVV